MKKSNPFGMIDTKLWYTITFASGEIHSAHELITDMYLMVADIIGLTTKEMRLHSHTVNQFGKYEKTYIGSVRGAKYEKKPIRPKDYGIQTPKPVATVSTN